MGPSFSEVLKRLGIPEEGWIIRTAECPTAPFAAEDDPVEAREVVREMERRRSA